MESVKGFQNSFMSTIDQTRSLLKFTSKLASRIQLHTPAIPNKSFKSQQIQMLPIYYQKFSQLKNRQSSGKKVSLELKGWRLQPSKSISSTHAPKTFITPKPAPKKLLSEHSSFRISNQKVRLKTLILAVNDAGNEHKLVSQIKTEHEAKVHSYFNKLSEEITHIADRYKGGGGK